MDLASLRAAVATGQSFDYLLFYGHTATPGRAVGAECLSQWYPAAFELAGVRYPTAEHRMMAAKAELFGDRDMLAQIVAAPSPADAKALGRRVKNYDDARWGARRGAAVVEASIAKFGQNPALCAFLLGTGDRVLVEAAPRDRIWGIGMGRTNPDATDPQRWRGQNLLGFALMAARDALRQSSPAPVV